MHAPAPRTVRTRLALGLLCAVTAMVVPSSLQEHAAAAMPPWGTVLVPGQDWAGQYANLGDLNVYSNGTGNQDQPERYGLGWECVELAQRWAALRYGEQPLWPVGIAAQMWAAAPGLRVPFTQIPNGSAAPQFGDLIIFDAQAWDTAGHVAVVADVGPGYVDVVEQNWAGTGFTRLPLNGTSMPARWGLNVIGWLRGPGGSTPPHTVNGGTVDSSRRLVAVEPDLTPFASTTSLSYPFHDMGGQLVASAAVTAIPSSRSTIRDDAVIVGTGLDQQLYVQTDTAPAWQALAPSGRCLGAPGAAVVAEGGATSLAIACRGADNAPWAFVEPIHTTAVTPWQGGWVSLGGSTHAGIAVGSVAGTTEVVVTGEDHHLWAQPVRGGAWRTIGAGLWCSARPAVSSANGVTWIACEGASDGALWYSSTSDGVSWSAPASAGGALVDGPSLVAMADGSVVADVAGADRQVWETTLTLAAAPTTYGAMGWNVRFGPSAVAVPLPRIALTLSNDANGGVARVEPNTQSITIGRSASIDGAVQVVSVPGNRGLAGRPLYVATFSDHSLQVRNDVSGWQPLSPAAGPSCLDGPGATMVGSTLTVACEASTPDHSLLSASGAVPGGGPLPTLTGWQSLGGHLTAGPAVASVGGAVEYVVTGMYNQFWQYTAAAGFVRIPGLACQNHPALVSAGTFTVAACTGTDAGLWWVAQSPAGAWAAPASAGGATVGGVAMVGFNGHATAFVRGLDNNVWETSITAADPPTPWMMAHTSLTGQVGAGAL